MGNEDKNKDQKDTKQNMSNEKVNQFDEVLKQFQSNRKLPSQYYTASNQLLREDNLFSDILQETGRETLRITLEMQHKDHKEINKQFQATLMNYYLESYISPLLTSHMGLTYKREVFREMKLQAERSIKEKQKKYIILMNLYCRKVIESKNQQEYVNILFDAILKPQPDISIGQQDYCTYYRQRLCALILLQHFYTKKREDKYNNFYCFWNEIFDQNFPIMKYIFDDKQLRKKLRLNTGIRVQAVPSLRNYAFKKNDPVKGDKTKEENDNQPESVNSSNIDENSLDDLYVEEKVSKLRKTNNRQSIQVKQSERNIENIKHNLRKKEQKNYSTIIQKNKICSNNDQIKKIQNKEDYLKTNSKFNNNNQKSNVSSQHQLEQDSSQTGIQNLLSGIQCSLSGIQVSQAAIQTSNLLRNKCKDELNNIRSLQNTNEDLNNKSNEFESNIRQRNQESLQKNEKVLILKSGLSQEQRNSLLQQELGTTELNQTNNHNAFLKNRKDSEQNIPNLNQKNSNQEQFFSQNQNQMNLIKSKSSQVQDILSNRVGDENISPNIQNYAFNIQNFSPYMQSCSSMMSNCSSNIQICPPLIQNDSQNIQNINEIIANPQALQLITNVLLNQIHSQPELYNTLKQQLSIELQNNNIGDKQSSQIKKEDLQFSMLNKEIPGISLNNSFPYQNQGQIYNLMASKYQLMNQKFNPTYMNYELFNKNNFDSNILQNEIKNGQSMTSIYNSLYNKFGQTQQNPNQSRVCQYKTLQAYERAYISQQNKITVISSTN